MIACEPRGLCLEGRELCVIIKAFIDDALMMHSKKNYKVVLITGKRQKVTKKRKKSQCKKSQKVVEKVKEKNVTYRKFLTNLPSGKME